MRLSSSLSKNWQYFPLHYLFPLIKIKALKIYACLQLLRHEYIMKLKVKIKQSKSASVQCNLFLDATMINNLRFYFKQMTLFGQRPNVFVCAVVVVGDRYSIS
jgi:hypothetical protein